MARKPIIDILGGVIHFGRLTFIGEAEPHKWRHREYRRALCRCDCGALRSVQPQKLVSGQTFSCGCMAAEKASKRLKTHGMTGTPEYVSWQSMKNRCYREEDISYPNYGGRGITVCDRWRESFKAFYADMGPRPDGMTLDRIEVNRNYEPANCRWATPLEQADNTRVARKLLVGRERINLSEAARRSGLSRSAINGRMARGMQADAAMQLPRDRTQGSRSKSNNRRVVYGGKVMLLCEVSDLTGIEGSHLNYHLRQGRTVDQAVVMILANRQTDKSACPQGHPMAGDNLYISPSGGRQCRECRKAARVRSNNRHRGTA